MTSRRLRRALPFTALICHLVGLRFTFVEKVDSPFVRFAID